MSDFTAIETRDSSSLNNMAVMQRRPRARNDGQLSVNKEVLKKMNDPRGVLGVLLVLLLLAVVFLSGQVKDTSSATTTGSNALKTSVTWFEIDPGVRLALEFVGREVGTTKMSPGRHTVSLQVPPKKSCPNPGLWIRLEGDVLGTIELSEGDTSWTGSFTIPLEGNFDLVSYWYGCDGDGILKERKILTNIIIKETTLITSVPFFPASVWISSKKFTQATDLSQPYVFHNPQIPVTEATLFKTSDSLLSAESAIQSETKFYQFEDLSNYELVCWVGSDSASMLHASFLQLRSHVNNYQRPFKFHFYDTKSFQRPDMTWSEENKKRFRKCKHILVSIDEVESPITQTEYTQQVTKFINHLLKAFPDETFPIWMFTVMESPIKPTNCLQPTLPRFSDHPCNTALKELFRQSPFPGRVRLLENTEITLPHLGENRKDVATAVALRIFVVVGKQVADWRAHGQVGNIHGLKRGDVQEPNFELVPYTDWEK